MKDCMVDVMKFCMKDLLTDSQIKGIVDAGLKKEEKCDEPYLELSTMPPDNNLCSASYDNDANICVRSYRQKFIKDKSDRTLCS